MARVNGRIVAIARGPFKEAALVSLLEKIQSPDSEEPQFAPPSSRDGDSDQDAAEAP